MGKPVSLKKTAIGKKQRRVGDNARLQLENRLLESEKRYRALFEQAADAIVVFDPQTLAMVDFNAEACRRLGYTRAEFARLKISDLEVIESAAETKRHARQVVRAGIAVFETKQRAKNGSVLDIEVRAKPIRVRDQTLIQGIWRDVTERKRIEEELRAGTDEWRATFDAVADAVFVLDSQQRVRRCNKGAVALFGKPAAKMLGRHCWEIVHGTTAPIPECPIARMRRSLRRESMELEIGGRSYQVVVDPLLTPDGRLRGAVHIVSDITERKRAEEALRHGEQRLAAIIEHMQEGLIIADPQGRVLTMNPAALRIHEYNSMAQAQRRLPEFQDTWELFNLDGGLLSLQQWPLARLMRGERFTDIEVCVRHKRTGREWFGSYSGTTLTDRQGRVQLIVMTLRDVTERRRMIEALRKSAAELEQRVQERTAELQLANSSLLQEMAQRSKLEREILEISEREQRRIGHDLHDSLGQRLAALKFMSNALTRRLAKKKLPGTLSAARIEQELQHAIEETRQIARGLHPIRPDGESLRSALYELSVSVSKLFKISCRFECSRLMVVHDYHAATHLYRIAQEAVSNAVRHARPKHIWIKLHRTSQHVCLVIEDDGRGVTADTKNGHGLGMGIMKYRAAHLGAIFAIAKRRGGGTRVTCDWKPSATEEKPTHHVS